MITNDSMLWKRLLNTNVLEVFPNATFLCNTSLRYNTCITVTMHVLLNNGSLGNRMWPFVALLKAILQIVVVEDIDLV